MPTRATPGPPADLHGDADDDRSAAPLSEGALGLTPEEQQLLLLLRGGDHGAAQALLRPHLGSLLALARRAARDPHWAHDLVQETLVRALTGLPAFRGDSSLRTWLFRILMRLAGQPRRWRRGEPAAALEVEVPDVLTMPEHLALSRELRDRLAEALERLPARQAAALHLRAFEGLDYAAIAAVLQCSVGAARMLVLEGRRRMQERMGRYLLP